MKSDFKHIARFAPIIGLLIGGLQAITWLTLSNFGWSHESMALITIVFGIWITGGLHLDGLIDTADGLAAGPQRCLEAMKDSRAGATGVLTVIAIFFVQTASLIQLEEMAPIAFPIATFWGRFAPIWAIENFPYLHKEREPSFHSLNWEGIKKEIRPSVLTLIFTICCIFVIPLTITNRIYIISSISIGILPAIIITNILGKKLGGHSGDSYGASLVLIETFILFILAILLKII